MRAEGGRRGVPGGSLGLNVGLHFLRLAAAAPRAERAANQSAERRDLTSCPHRVELIRPLSER